MAEFKLGRIRFVWKGDWVASTSYYKDDVIRFGGNTYICTVGHVADSNFYTDLDFVPTKWNQMTAGQEWKDVWTTSTFYKLGDTVKYGGTVYVANESHTSAATATLGLEQDLAKWDVFAEGFDWKDVWATGTRYKPNDLVKYGGITYVCNTGHTSAATTLLGLEDHQSNWDEFNEGLQYRGDWSGSSIRYRVNDVVKYGAGTWICIAAHVSTGTFATDEANWNQFNEGVEFGGDWSSATTYQPGDVVRYGGNQYVAKTNHVNSVPTTGTTDWDLFSEGFRYYNDWSNSTSYKIGSVVRLNGHTYLAKADSPRTAITVTASSSSTNRFTTSATTGMVAGMTIMFTGTTFGNVLPNAHYYVKTVVSLTEFTITTTPDGATFTPSSGTGSMGGLVAAMPPNTTYWEKLSAGVKWLGEWTDDVEYHLGDIVRYGSNAYICINDHHSEGDDGSTIGAQGGGAALSRPDRDSAGTYWNIFSVGDETDLLTTRGDLVYFGGAGPTRLPVGVEGQVLTVSESLIPEWTTLGKVDQVYFVANHGTDGPAPVHGLTVDKPWASIRYACEQVEKGPRNPDAARLLELNRPFIQREIVEWIDYQVSNGLSPFTVGFTYDDNKCERDMGFIIDSLIHDIRHGGNQKSRDAALSYVNDAPRVYTLGQETETVAAINYGLSVIANVLAQESPETVYQIENGDNSTSIVAQWTDANIAAETGVLADVTGLVGIITDAITAGVDDDVPAQYIPSKVIEVKTGRYREVLPIVVPAETCILGDEVRSTNAGPRGATTSIFDAKYSMGALTRLESVVGDIITGATVTKTAGNAESQVKLFPYGDTSESTLAKRLVRAVQTNVDFRLGTMIQASYPNPTNYNTSYLVGYGDSRKNIKENKGYFQEQVVAFLTEQYPGVKYSTTACKRDVGYIVDALVYDLTYGGYTQSINAGLAYFDGVDGAMMIDSEELTATIAAYNFLKGMLGEAAQAISTGGYATDAVQFKDTAGSAGSVTFIEQCLDYIIAIVTSGTSAAPTITVTSITGANTCNTASAHGLLVGDTFTPTSTANGLTSGVEYYIVSAGITTFTLSTSFGGSAITLTNGTGLTIVGNVVNTPATSWASGPMVTAFTTLSAARSTIVSNMTSYLSSNYPGLVYNSAKCERDVRIIIDAVGYDFMFNSNFQTLKAAYAYLRASANDVFDLGQKTATRAAFEYVRTQARANVGGNTTAQSRIDTLMQLLDDVVFTGSVEGTNVFNPLRNTHYAARQLELNKDFIAAEIDAYIAATYTGTATSTSSGTDVITTSSTSWLQRGTAIRFTGTTFGGIETGTTYYVLNVVSSTTFTVGESRTGTALVLTSASGSMTFDLYYNSDLCLRDVVSYVDAVKYDLVYTGNYKSLMAARYYSNSVTGSLEEDMYYLRNGTGIRNQTLEGLSGDLTSTNEYGTSRVTAGAYVSLDPGWGPDDNRTWITSRSPYVQNVCTFGTAAVGQKIDGALHNGGNKSIVSNDFTQIISDGIGAWVTNNGRAELVSVFTYYSHIGYLSENGGRIRGTNGNNSYGDFGSVAEGFDSSETPNTGIVDNRYQFNATVGSVFTDSNKVVAFEFDNAGTNYSEVDWNITGAGLNADSEGNEFRDDAVFQVRLLDLGNDSSGQYGGEGYVTNSNTAQGGTTTSITVAATDQEISSAYVGMKVVLTGGTGVGQYAIISAYNAGTKVAAVVKESTGASGWDHMIPGTTLVVPDASTTYTIEPAVSFTGPSFAATASTLPSSSVWVDSTYGDVYVTYTAVSGTTSGSGIGATFNVTRKGLAYSVETNAAGTGYQRLDTITIAGTSLGGASTTNDVTLTITSVNSTTGAIQAFDTEGSAQGGAYVAIADSTTATARSTDGITWSAGGTLPSSTAWTTIANGALTITENAGSFIVGRTYTILEIGTTNWTAIGASAGTIGTRFVATGAGSGTGTATPTASAMVAVAQNGTNAYSHNAGATWTAGGTMPVSSSWNEVAYGAGRFVALAASATTTAYSTTGGRSWTSGGALPSSASWTGLAYGAGTWVAVASGSNSAASSTDGGVTWTARTLPSSSNWSSVTYGNGRFVAVSATSGTVAAYSLDGITWTASTLPATALWTDVTYGQGVFLAVSQSTAGATSEDGIVWTSRTMSTAANGFSSAAFGNPNRYGQFVAVQRSTAGTVASYVRTGAKARARAFVSQEKIFAIRVVEPGSGYASAPTMTITDPSNIYEAPFTVRLGKGALAMPSMTNRGVGYVAAGAEVLTGNGYGDFYQSGSYIAVRRLTQRPVAGSNVVFGDLPGRTFKLVNVLSFRGNYDGSYTAQFQVSPTLAVNESPEHGDDVTTRIRYSQVRLTGHDFLDIGTGSFTETNYPNTPTQDPIQANETVEGNGGRVFFTSTDQDGNFRVGDLFTIEQSTGIATLNADAFNIAGLQELTLGEVTLGGASASITEFSTDPFFTSDSDSVVPTQRAIKAYISSQIGGGGASLNVNSVTAGYVFINTNQITTTTGGAIQMKARFDFRGGVTGYPVAWNYFLNN